MLLEAFYIKTISTEINTGLKTSKKKIKKKWKYSNDSRDSVILTLNLYFLDACAETFLDIQATIELKRVRDMIKTYGQFHLLCPMFSDKSMFILELTFIKYALILQLTH